MSPVAQSRWLRWFASSLPVAFVILALAGGCSQSVESTDQSEIRDPEMRKAQSLMDAGKPEEAVRAYEQILDRRPGIARAHLALAILQHDSTKDPVGAVYHYRKYLALRPTTQKRKMIDDRIRLALQALLTEASAARDASAREELDALKKENQQLSEEIKALRKELGSSRRRNGAGDGTGGLAAVAGGPRKHTVAAGENLTHIAVAYGLKAGDLVRANGLKDANSIRVGQVLLIPASSATAEAP